jgi:membrane protein DedA with SNARE-associated domain
MKTGSGMWIAILGILLAIIGGVMYATNNYQDDGMYIAILGVIVLLIGPAWWMIKGREAPKTAIPQSSQPAKTP